VNSEKVVTVNGIHPRLLSAPRRNRMQSDRRMIFTTCDGWALVSSRIAE